MKTILVNTGSNLGVTLVKLIITFVMTPVFVHNLGNYDYGIWEIIGAVLGYMGLLDLGMKPTISRFAAKYHANNEKDQLQTLYSTSLVFLGVIGILLLVFFVVWGLFWPHLLAEGASDVQKYSILLFIIGAQLFIVFPGFVAESFLEGFQKYYLKNNITIVNSIIGSTILYIYMTPENALILLAAANAIGLSIKYIIYTGMLSRASFGGLKPIFRKASWVSFKETAVFGFKSLVQGIASRIEIGTDTIVIGAFLGPAMVPFYAIPANLISYIRNIGWTITHAFMPFFSSLEAQNKKDEMRSVYIMASRYVVAFLLPLCVGASVVGGPFIGVWIGEEYLESADLIILLLVIYTSLPFINPFSTRYLTATGEHGILAKLYPIAAAVNLGASIILVQYWGVVGVAVGSVIPVFFVVPYVMKRCCNLIGISVVRYIKEVIIPVTVPTLCMFIAVFLMRKYWPLTSYFKIIMAVGVGGFVYSVLFIMIGMNTNERSWLKTKLKARLP